MASSTDTAVRLIKQAILQDSKKNYEEASRCYHDALQIFYSLGRDKSTPNRLREFLACKVPQYEERVRVIDAHLLAQNDWTKFFKDIEPCTGEECRSSLSSDSRHLYKNPLLAAALDNLRRGREADSREHFLLALHHYEAGLTSLQHIINKGLLTERQERAARAKCLMYHERSEVIRAGLEGGKKIRGCGGRSRCESEASLNSVCDSPVPQTESDKIMQMTEVHSCSSRMGSTTSIPFSPDTSVDYSKRRALSPCDPLNKTHDTLHGSLPMLAHHVHPQHHLMHQTSWTGNGDAKHLSQPLLYYNQIHPNQRPMHPHMGFPVQPHHAHGKARHSTGNGKPPIATMSMELALSRLSLGSQASSRHTSSSNSRASQNSVLAGADCAPSRYTVDEDDYAEDRVEPELAKLVTSVSCENLQTMERRRPASQYGMVASSSEHYLISRSDKDAGAGEESDSGYSDPSPYFEPGSKSSGSSGGVRATDGGFGSSSPSRLSLSEQRSGMKSPASTLSDLSEVDCEEKEERGEIIPHVVILPNGENRPPTATSEDFDRSNFPRRYARQRSMFQNPDKDILTSLMSRENLAVIGQESVDLSSLDIVDGPTPANTRTSKSKDVPADAYVKSPRTVPTGAMASNPGGGGPGAVPTRASAYRNQQQQPDDEDNACFYVMTALDFCWCL